MTTVLVSMPKKNEMTLPSYLKKIQVGADFTTRWPDFLHDNDGNNISLKYEKYGPLTALYYAYQNIDDDVIGLMQNRLFLGNYSKLNNKELGFRNINKLNVAKKVLTEENINKYLENYDIILPNKEYPYPLNGLEGILRFVSLEHVNIFTSYVKDNLGEYYDELLKCYKREALIYYNIFIAKNKEFKDISKFIFDNLKNLEDLIPLESQNPNESYYFGEMLLNLYVIKNKLSVKYLNTLHLMDNTKRGIKGAINIFLSSLHIFPFSKHRAIQRARVNYFNKKKQDKDYFSHVKRLNIGYEFNKFNDITLATANIGDKNKDKFIDTYFFSKDLTDINSLDFIKDKDKTSLRVVCNSYTKELNELLLEKGITIYNQKEFEIIVLR
jgi:hypothetical protein